VRFHKIDPRIWNDEKFAQFTDDGKLAFLFLLTHPGMTALGAMRATWDGLAAELRWTLRRWENAIAPAVRLGMVEVDRRKAYVGLPNWLRYNEPQSPNAVKAWLAALDLLPECPGRQALARRCIAYLEAASVGFRQAVGDHVLDAFRDAMREGIREGIADAMPHPVAVAVAVAEATPLTPLQGNGEDPPETPPFTPEDLKAVWNEHLVPSMRKCLGLAGERLAHAKARLRERPDRQFWDDLIRRFAGSSYVRRGGTHGTWRPGIGYLLNTENIFKVLEGTFDEAPPPGRRPQTVSDLDAHAREVRALAERERH